MVTKLSGDCVGSKRMPSGKRRQGATGFHAPKAPSSFRVSSKREYAEYLARPADLMTTAVKACREIEFCRALAKRSAIRLPATVKALALIGEREPIVRPASAERMAITARSSIREYPRGALCTCERDGLTMLSIWGQLKMKDFYGKCKKSFACIVFVFIH